MMLSLYLNNICIVGLWILSGVYGLIGVLIYCGLFAVSGVMLWAYASFLIIAYFMITITPIILIAGAIGAYKIFERMGEKGWKAFIPILNMYVVYEKIDMKHEFIPVIVGILFLYLGIWDKRSLNPTSLGLILFSINMIITIVAMVLVPIILVKAAYKLPRKFGWSKLASILYIFFSPICLPILGFGNYKFNSEELGKTDKDKELTKDTNPEMMHIE